MWIRGGNKARKCCREFRVEPRERKAQGVSCQVSRELTRKVGDGIRHPGKCP